MRKMICRNILGMAVKAKNTKLDIVEVVLERFNLLRVNMFISRNYSYFLEIKISFQFSLTLQKNLSKIEKEVGNVRKETELSFRFKLKDPSKTKNFQTVPFQVGIIIVLIL